MNALEILKKLPKTNCGKCGQQTCLAFATLITQGKMKLLQCPYLGKDTIEDFSGLVDEWKKMEKELQGIPARLKKQFDEMDFREAAQRLKAKIKNDMLDIKCLGRHFIIDHNGDLHSDCHNNIWIYVPLLQYILYCKGRSLTGEWIKFDQLRDAASFSDFFYYKCEDVLRGLADTDEKLFFDILKIFGGNPIDEEFTADYSVKIYPLPRVPFLISYWKSDKEFPSTLSIYFDRATDDNLDVESLHIIALGFVEMLKRIMATHFSGAM